MIQLAAVLATGASHVPISGRSIDSDVIVLAAPARLTSVRPEPVEGLSLSSDCGLEGQCFDRLSTNGFPGPLQLPTSQELAAPILIAPPAPTPQQIALASFFAAAAPPDPIVRRLAMIDRPRRRLRDRRQMLARIDSAPPRPPVPLAPPPAPEAPPLAPIVPAALASAQPIAFRPIRLAFAGAPPTGGPDPLRTRSDNAPLEVAALATPAAVAAMPTQAELQSAPAPEAVAPLPPPPLVEDPNNPDNAAPPALSGDADKAVLDDRRRPGVERPLPERVMQDNPGAVRAPPPEAFGSKEFPIPDRWRLIQSLGLVKENLLDPYHQNTLKGDRPLCHATPEEQERREEAHIAKCVTPGFLKGDDWFIALNATSDTVVEPRTFPIPTGIQYPTRPGQNDVFGKDTSFAFAQTFIVGASLIKGDTTFMPPEIEYRLVLAYQNNFARVPERRVLYVDPTKGRSRWDSFLGVQEAFIDYHIKNTSDRYDFYSVRVGIQPFNLDFRGFLFNDQTLGVRLFGNRDNNRFQWNVAGLWRIEKDTNSGLNDLGQPLRKDWVLFANAYRQDFPMPGLTSEAIVAWNINREGDDKYIDKNGFPVRPALIGTCRAAITTSSISAMARKAASAASICRCRPMRRSARTAITLSPANARTSAASSPPPSPATTWTGSASAAPRSGRAATRMRSAAPRPALIRSRRTRSSPAPTPATGSVRPCRSSAAVARSP